jgi:hypothetical protein
MPFSGGNPDVEVMIDTSIEGIASEMRGPDLHIRVSEAMSDATCAPIEEVRGFDPARPTLLPNARDRFDARLVSRGGCSTVAWWQSFLGECELRRQSQLARIERNSSLARSRNLAAQEPVFSLLEPWAACVITSATSFGACSIAR